MNLGQKLLIAIVCAPMSVLVSSSDIRTVIPSVSHGTIQAAPQKDVGVRLEHLTWLEAEEVFETHDVVVIPLGAITKEHGPHLPLNNDFLMAEYLADRVAQDAPPAVRGQSFEERLVQVTDFLSDQGFLTRWEKTDEGYVITNINCPYRRVSRDHSELCIMDTEMIGQLMKVEPERLSSGHGGETPCKFLLRPPE